jgi:ArsR family transcriptional regulator, lead/cadmium/zinc/bismuth-responsive transcriptional repressor
MSPLPPPTCPSPCSTHPRVEAARTHLLSVSTAAALADLFRACADATRVRIMVSLLHQELCTCDLAELIGVSASGISQHLRVLRALRVVTSHRRGKLVLHTLADTHVRLLLQVGLSHVRDGDTHHPLIERLLTQLTTGVGR